MNRGRCGALRMRLGRPKLFCCLMVLGGCGGSEAASDGGRPPVVESGPSGPDAQPDAGGPQGTDSAVDSAIDAEVPDGLPDGAGDSDTEVVFGDFTPYELAAASTQRPALTALPGGEFMMGSPGNESGRGADEGPEHRVRLSPFAICQTEVTQRQYQELMSSNPSSDICTCDQSCGDDYPVSCVSWFAAVAYLNALSEAEGLVSCYEGEEPSINWVSGCTGYRLPTEAEWEFAARGGTDSAYPFGEVGDLGIYAWFRDNSGADPHPHPVADLAPTVWATGAELYDMQGNLWEWVWDRYRSDYYADSPRDNPINSDGYDNCIAPGCRVIRGGAFLNLAPDLRVAKRNSTWPAQAEPNIGFRCARSLPSSP